MPVSEPCPCLTVNSPRSQSSLSSWHLCGARPAINARLCPAELVAQRGSRDTQQPPCGRHRGGDRQGLTRRLDRPCSQEGFLEGVAPGSLVSIPTVQPPSSRLSTANRWCLEMGIGNAPQRWAGGAWGTGAPAIWSASSVLKQSGWSPQCGQRSSLRPLPRSGRSEGGGRASGPEAKGSRSTPRASVSPPDSVGAVGMPGDASQSVVGCGVGTGRRRGPSGMSPIPAGGLAPPAAGSGERLLAGLGLRACSSWETGQASGVSRGPRGLQEPPLTSDPSRAGPAVRPAPTAEPGPPGTRDPAVTQARTRGVAKASISGALTLGDPRQDRPVQQHGGPRAKGHTLFGSTGSFHLNPF